MRILIITEAMPYPPDSGAPLRTFNLMARLAREHEVWLATLLDSSEQIKSLPPLRELFAGVEGDVYRRQSPLAHLPSLVRYSLKGWPLELRFRHSNELAKKISEMVSAHDFDIVQIEHSDMALYREALPPYTRGKLVLMFHNVVSEQYDRIFRVQQKSTLKARAWLHSRMMRRWETQYAERFDRCIAVSDVDRRMLEEANPHLEIDVIPNGVDTREYQPLPETCDGPVLLFVGTMRYAANADAMVFFCREILPRVKESIPEVELWIVGIDPLPEVKSLAGDGVHVTGRVEDVIPYYQRSTAVVVPLRAGGGTRLKILEAMALGRPVVSTTVGCEGLEVVPDQHLLMADNADLFAGQTIRVLKDAALRKRINKAARALVVERYDWDTMAERLLRIYAEMIDGAERPGRSVPR